MSFPFKLKEGWEELPGKMAGRIQVIRRWPEFWSAAAEGDVKAVAGILHDAGMQDEKTEDEPDIEDFFAALVPDPVRGDFMRIWVKARKKFVVLEEE
jgi:hypothetical protein